MKSDLPFVIILVTIVVIVGAGIYLSRPVPAEVADAHLPPQPEAHDQTAQMQIWLGDALPSSKLRLHR